MRSPGHCEIGRVVAFQHEHTQVGIFSGKATVVKVFPDGVRFTDPAPDKLLLRVAVRLTIRLTCRRRLARGTVASHLRGRRLPRTSGTGLAR